MARKSVSKIRVTKEGSTWIVRQGDKIIAERHFRRNAMAIKRLAESIANPRPVRKVRPLVVTPDRCAKCGEAFTPRVVKGAQCKCQMPRIPRDLIGDDTNDRPPMQVRYGN